MTWLERWGVFGLLVSSALGACGDDAPLTAGAANRGDDQESEGEGAFGDGDSSGGDADGDSEGDDASGEEPPLPPEQEETLSFDIPQAGKTAVYIPNPVTNRVAVVNAETFAIETVATGTAPTYVATVPGQDVAVVINAVSHDAALLRTVDGHTKVSALPLTHDANAIAIAPNGKHAVLYFDAAASSGLAASFQDVTVVDLEEGHEHARGVSVGFRPRGVQFSGDSTRAFVNTEDGVSIVDLAAAVEGPVIARLVSIGDSLSDALSKDVQVTPDGRYALARRDGSSVMRLVNLESGAIEPFDLKSIQIAPTPVSIPDGGIADAGEEDELPGVVGNMLSPGTLDLSDMDLAPDGSFVLAVERVRGALLRIPLPAGFSDPTQIEITEVTDQLVGQVSISKPGNLAVLYTSVNNAEGVVLVDLTEDRPPRGVRLRKGVRAVAFSDNGSRALVLHSRVGSTTAASDDEAKIDASDGYSLIDTASGFAKLQLTPAAIRQSDVLLLDGPGKFYALLRDDTRGVRTLEIADLNSFQVTQLTLARPPAAMGLLPGLNRIFIGQENEGGMVTFVDSTTGMVTKAVSGFELATRIRQ